MFDLDGYKPVLKASLLERQRRISRTYTFQNMAKACRVQKTYLSRVFNGDAHLNDDQLFLACAYLGFSEDESRYVSLLHLHERSSVAEKRERLRREIEAMRQEHLTVSRHLKAASVPLNASDYAEYYLDPSMQIVHMYLTIERYARDIGKVREQIGISEVEMTAVLARLTRLGFIAFRSGRYHVLKDGMHLPAESPLYRPYRTLLRVRALQRIEWLPPGETYNFSVLFTADDDARRRIQAHFLEFAKKVEEEVKGAPARDVYQLGFDLFKWSK